VENDKDSSNIGEEFEFKDGLFYHRRLLHVYPRFMQLKILQVYHDSHATRNFGFNKTIELITRDF
jgi:hypothetical protein